MWWLDVARYSDTELPRITGLKLEVLPSAGVLSRGKSGEFILTDIKAQVRRRTSTQVRDILVGGAVSDTKAESKTREYGDVKGTLDNDPRNGWTTTSFASGSSRSSSKITGRIRSPKPRWIVPIQRRACEVSMMRTNTPLQALTMLNDQTMMEASQALARVLLSTQGDFATRLSLLSNRVLSRNATASELVKPELIRWSDASKLNPAYKVDDVKPSQLRNEFAEWMTHPENPRLAAAIANRVWKKVFGLAVQEPVSDIDDISKASNPALLAHLATIVKAGNFDLREFQRVLFNSQTYQRAASVSPDLEKGPYLFPGPLVRRMMAEQVWDSLMVASVGPEVDNMVLRRGEQQKLMSLPGDAATEENFKYVIERMSGAGAAMGGGGKKKAGGGSEKGLISAYQGGKPQQRFGMILARASELPQPAAETHFLRLFGQSDRLIADTNTTDGSVPQALMLMNGGAGKLISETNCAAVTLAGNAASDDAKIDSLYLAFLARKPTAAERPVATQALTTGLGISDIAWALANTREFLFIQ